MFGLSLLEFISLAVGITTLIGATVGGITFLIKAVVGGAIEKGDLQAAEIKEDIQQMGTAFTESLSSITTSMATHLEMMGTNLSNQIESNDKASRDRGANLGKRLEEHNESMQTQLGELKAQQVRQLDFIKEVNDDVKKNKDLTSKVSNRVSVIEGQLRVNG